MPSPPPRHPEHRARTVRPIRAEAEARLEQLHKPELENTSEEVRRLMHELSVHQIELEMQNEQLRQAQEELEGARARYFDLYERAPVAYLILNQGGRIIECNSAAAQLLQARAYQLSGRSIGEFIASGGSGEYAAQRDQLLATGEPQSVELVLCRPDGSSFWGELHMNAADPAADKSPNTRITITDITRRKQMELEAARLAAIVISSDHAILSQELTGEISSWNPAAERLFGFSAAEILGSPLVVLYPPERVAEERADRDRARRGIPVTHESVRVHQGGSRIPVFVSISPIIDRQGHISGVSHLIRDIREELASRDQLNEALAHLRENARALRQADRRKDEFIATLAHELRNPLAPIRNAAAVLRYGPKLDPKIEWCRDVIDRQVGHMATLLDDLLDVSRVTRNKIKLHRERVELFRPIAQALELNRPLIDERQHTLTVDLPPEPIEVVGDVTRLTQIFGNLLNNAAKYTDPGGKIQLQVVQQDEIVEVVVRDSGIGIEAAQLPSVFELFSQVDTTGDRSQGGLGIGLSLVKALVEMHGGTIAAASEGLGQGSEFTVRLPVVANRRGGEVSFSGSAVRVSQPVPETQFGNRVLIVDDNRDAADSMAVMLTLQGYQVRTAWDGEEAISVAREYRPDVAILDVGLPKLNGLEVGRRIRQEPWGRSMLLIACTGWGQPEDQHRSNEAGFDHHLVKPVDLDALIQLLSSRPPPDIT